MIVYGRDPYAVMRHPANARYNWKVTKNFPVTGAQETDRVMSESTKNARVDALLDKAEKWRREFEQLRTIVLDCGLCEELKWGKPCYTYKDKNIVLIHGFKNYCALLFFKGALMKDPDGLLIQQTENVQAGRQVRFANLQEIVERQAILQEYVREAVEVEDSGQKIAAKQTTDFPVGDEFRKKLDQSPGLKAAFSALTPGRQRAYLLYFAAAKRSKTRESRIERNIQKILDGAGLDD